MGIRTARPKYSPHTTTTPVITDARPCRLGEPGGYTRLGRPWGGNDSFMLMAFRLTGRVTLPHRFEDTTAEHSNLHARDAVSDDWPRYLPYALSYRGCLFALLRYNSGIYL